MFFIAVFLVALFIHGVIFLSSRLLKIFVYERTGLLPWLLLFLEASIVRSAKTVIFCAEIGAVCFMNAAGSVFEVHCLIL